MSYRQLFLNPWYNAKPMDIGVTRNLSKAHFYYSCYVLWYIFKPKKCIYFVVYIIHLSH